MNGYGYLIVGIVVVAIIALLATNKKFVETLKTVSYTHLDVYKRQVVMRVTRKNR